MNEAQSQASMQARKLNLVSDGHGGWLDSRGKFVATTEDGKLKFVDKKKAKGEEETKAQPKAQAKPEEKDKKKLDLKRLVQRKQRQVKVEKVLERLQKL